MICVAFLSGFGSLTGFGECGESRLLAELRIHVDTRQSIGRILKKIRGEATTNRYPAS